MRSMNCVGMTFRSTIGEPPKPPTTRRLLMRTSVRFEPRSRRSIVAAPAPDVENAVLVVLNAGVPIAGFSSQDVLDVDGARLVDVRLADDLDRRERGDVRRRNARTGDDDRLGRPGLGVLATLSGGVRRILLRRRGLIGGRRIELRLRLRVRRLSCVSRARLRKRRARERDARKQRRNHVSLRSHFFPLRRAVPTEPRRIRAQSPVPR